MLYTVIVTSPKTKNYIQFFKNLPIKNKANGSVAPSLIDGKVWNDYCAVTVEEIDALLDYIDNQKNNLQYDVQIRKFIPTF